MTRAERWKRFVTGRGWLNDGIIAGTGGDKLILAVRTPGEGYGAKCAMVEKALVLEDEDILCYECASGTIFFQWDDILQIRHEPVKTKKGWL